MTSPSQKNVGLDDEQLLALSAAAEDFILASFASRDLVAARDVGAHICQMSPNASNPAVYFAVLSAIASLRTKGLLLFGDNDVQHHIVTTRKAHVPLLASFLVDQSIRYKGSYMTEKQNPFHSGGRPIVPTAKCLNMIAVKTTRSAGSLTRWVHVDLLLDELASVYHLGSPIGAAGLARAIVEELIRQASNDIPNYSLPDKKLASQIRLLFDEIQRHNGRKSFTVDGDDQSMARSTIEHVRTMGNSALHSANSPKAVDLQVVVLSTLPRAATWLSGASDPAL